MEILEIQFAGGHKIEVNASAFFQIALKEAAEVEISIAPGDFGIREGKQTPVLWSLDRAANGDRSCWILECLYRKSKQITSFQPLNNAKSQGGRR